MGIVRLGKLLLRWCDHCNVPVLEYEKCGKCGTVTRQVEMTPPGDVRPAFAYNINFIREVLNGQFGQDAGKLVLPEDKIVLLNKAPGIDRMEEVIVDGEVLGTLRFDMGQGWRFIMRVNAAQRLQGKERKGTIIADDGAIQPMLKSNNLMAPGVIRASEGIQKGDEVIILDRQLRAVCTGVARMTSEEMKLREKGAAVKNRWASEPMDFIPRTGGQDWSLVLEANSKVMDDRIKEGINFIKDVYERNKLPTIISFSGGKDSLACLLLSLDAGFHFPAFFIDTGLEFPETVEYVQKVKEHYGLDLIVEKAPENAFFGNLEYFGPPGRDYRWCCKTNKLGPTVRAISEHFPGGVLSFIGQRRYESEQRADKPRVWKNPWTPGQIGASPIQNWTALHVWIYIFMRKAPINPWYERGLDRIGCFLCPASDQAELEMVAPQSAPLRSWNEYLIEYAQKRGLPEQWVKLGLWRWRKVPPSIMEELAKNGVSAEELKRNPMQEQPGSVKLLLRMQEGFSPCIVGFSIEGAFSRPIDLKNVANLLNMVGPVELNLDEGWCSVPGVTVFQEGAMVAKGKEQERIREKIDTVRKVVVKAEECVGCGVCVARCKEGALMMDRDRISINIERCTHCGGCIEPCPAISFGDTTFDF